MPWTDPRTWFAGETVTAAVPSGAARTPIGTATLFDTSGPYLQYWHVDCNNSSTLRVNGQAAGPVAGGTPWAWATGDEVLITGTYEAA